MFHKNQKLKGVTIRQMFLLITYTIVLIWGILNYSQVLGGFTNGIRFTKTICIWIYDCVYI